jgi:membrane protease subunit (stomatin/prohibitin family)
MSDLPNLENLDERMEFRLTPSEKQELYHLAGKQAPRWVRWGVQQALKVLREQSTNPQASEAKAS